MPERARVAGVEPRSGPGRPSGTAAVAGLRIQVLGGFRVAVGPRVVEQTEWRRRKASALVKLLALAPEHRLHREQVLEQLWPELELEAAANNLHGTLHAARRVLEPDLGPGRRAAYLTLHGEAVVLSPSAPVWVDAEAFEAAAAEARRRRDPAAFEAALALYAGDLLPEERYEDWAVARREELRRAYLGLLIELAGLCEARGVRAAAVEALERVLAAEPCHEEAHVGLMRLHAAAGQRHQALRQYQQLCEVLRRELDVEPDEASRRLHDEILAGRVPRPVSAPVAPTPAPPRPRSHNLPSPLTSFVGREREIADVRRLFSQVRLLTLAGPGGVGKTRLALQVAADLVGAYPDGVWLVELAQVTDPVLLPRAVASVLGLREASLSTARDSEQQSSMDTLVDFLRTRQALLLLDNCEHIVDACAALAGTLLRACPGLRILATSRQALGIVGEAVRPVPPLSLRTTDDGRPTTGDEPAVVGRRSSVVDSEAVRLFADRARLVRPDFSLSGRNARAVAQVCQRLDGLPLAIELAAARTNVLSPDQLAERLDDRFRLLAGGDRTAPPRHQTLRAATEWSYGLLSEPERALFDRLSVFAGGWSLEAAEAIAGDGLPSPDILDVLSQLVDKSLVVAEPGPDGAIRYRLLETLREYGLERLAKRDEAAEVRRRHASFFLALAEETETKLLGPEQAVYAERLEREHDNLRAALRWALENGAVEVGLRLGGALWKFWEVRGHLSEGERWLDAVLSAPVPSPESQVPSPESQVPGPKSQVDRDLGLGTWDLDLVRARTRALNGAGNLAHDRGDYARAAALHEENLLLRRQLGDVRGIAVTLHNLGHVARTRGDYPAARDRLEEGLALFRELGDSVNVALSLLNLARLAQDQGENDRAKALSEESLALFREVGHTQGVAASLNKLGELARERGDCAAARAFHEQSLAIHRERGDAWGAAISLNYLGRVAQREGDSERAAAMCAEALALLRDLGATPDVATSLEVLADAARARGQVEGAARLFGATARLHDVLGARLTPTLRADHERSLADTRAQLGAEAFATAWAEGRAMTPEQAIAVALALVGRP